MAGRPVVTVLPSTEGDCILLAERMRLEERLEVEASGGFAPLEAALASVRRSLLPGTERGEAWTVRFDGQVAFMWGIARFGYSRSGAAWLLTTDLVERHPRTFWLYCRAELPKILERWDIIANAIDARHAKALRWARRLGFRVEEAEPFGAQGLPFHTFTASKEDLHV